MSMGTSGPVAMATPYGEPLWRRFSLTPHAGLLLGDQVVMAEAGTPGSDAVIRLTMRAGADGHCETGFQAHGCPAVIAAAEMLCEYLSGETDMADTQQFLAECQQQLQLPAEKRYCLLMLEDLIGAVQKLSREKGIEQD